MRENRTSTGAVAGVLIVRPSDMTIITRSTQYTQRLAQIKITENTLSAQLVELRHAPHRGRLRIGFQSLPINVKKEQTLALARTLLQAHQLQLVPTIAGSYSASHKSTYKQAREIIKNIQIPTKIIQDLQDKYIQLGRRLAGQLLIGSPIVQLMAQAPSTKGLQKPHAEQDFLNYTQLLEFFHYYKGHTRPIGSRIIRYVNFFLNNKHDLQTLPLNETLLQIDAIQKTPRKIKNMLKEAKSREPIGDHLPFVLPTNGPRLGLFVNHFGQNSNSSANSSVNPQASSNAAAVAAVAKSPRLPKAPMCRYPNIWGIKPPPYEPQRPNNAAKNGHNITSAPPKIK